MILEYREIKEYHKNGQLMYETTLGVVAPMFRHLYKNAIYTKDETLIRVGITRRFWDNGRLNWMLKYNEDGTLSSEKFPQYRKDGTIINY